MPKKAVVLGGLIISLLLLEASGMQTVRMNSFINDIAVDAAGNTYVTGTAESWNWDCFVGFTSKYSPSGELLWTNKIPNEGGLVVKLDSKADVYVLTGTKFAKYSSSGVEKWIISHGCQMTYGELYVDSWGNPYIAFVGGVAKFNPSGEELWRSKYTDEIPGVFNLIAGDAGGNVYAVGGNFMGCDAIVAKFGPDGTCEWADIYGNPQYTDYACNVVVDHEGMIIVTGMVVIQNCGKIMTKKYHPNGTLLWEKAYNEASNDFYAGQGLAVDAAGNVYVEGIASENKIVIVKYDASGTEQWVQNVPLRNNTILSNDRIKDIMSVTPGGNIYVFGNTVDGKLGLAKYNTSGGQEWLTLFDHPGASWTIPFALTLDSAGRASIGGSLGDAEGFHGLVLNYQGSGAKNWAAILDIPSQGCGYAEQNIRWLIYQITAWNLGKGIEDSLVSKLQAALNILSDENPANDIGACGQLNAFVQECLARRDKDLSAEKADYLLFVVDYAIRYLGCR